MNKLAAGALALALGLGAVAPAVAAETYTGAQLVLEKYERELKDANAKREKALIAEAKIAEAKANLAKAKENLAKAKKAYEAKFPELKNYLTLDGEASGEILDYTAATDASLMLFKEDRAKAQKDVKEKYIPKYNQLLKDNKYDEAKAKEELIKFIDGIYSGVNKDTKKDVYNARVQVYAEQIILLAKSESKVASSTEYKAYVAAQYEYSVAEDRLKDVKDKYEDDITEYEKALNTLKDRALAYGFTVQIGNNGIQLVKPEDAKVKAPGKKDSISELKRAKADAETAIKAVKLLKELSPEKIKKVEAKLNEKVMKAEELIKKVDAKIAQLEKKTAFIATAYADEDDTDALIKELDQTTGEIKDLIKDTPEDKKANEEKPAEKPAEDKKEEKTPSKKAGNNARTGIAGVAGVAGILAAASVAYAASKRD